MVRLRLRKIGAKKMKVINYVSIPQMVRLRPDIKFSFIIYLKAKKVNIFLSIYGRAKK